MPAWNRIMEKLVHGEKDDGLQVAMKQLVAYEVQSPRLPGLPGVLAPYALKDFKFPPETHHITMDGMVHTLIEIIIEARVSMKKPLERTDKMPHIVMLYKQDLKDLKTDDQNNFV